MRAFVAFYKTLINHVCLSNLDRHQRQRGGGGRGRARRATASEVGGGPPRGAPNAREADPGEARVRTDFIIPYSVVRDLVLVLYCPLSHDQTTNAYTPSWFAVSLPPPWRRPSSPAKYRPSPSPPPPTPPPPGSRSRCPRGRHGRGSRRQPRLG